MARPVTISNERILEAARDVFLRRGVAASTAEIARKARVSEGTLFKRFATKEQLFLAAMRPEQPEWVERMQAMVGHGDVRENLLGVAREMLEFYRRSTPRIIHIWASMIGDKRRRPGPDNPAVVGIRLMAQYLAAETERGRLRVANPEVTARVLLGALHKYAFQELLGLNEVFGMDPDRFVREAIDLLWKGIAPR